MFVFAQNRYAILVQRTEGYERSSLLLLNFHGIQKKQSRLPHRATMSNLVGALDTRDAERAPIVQRIPLDLLFERNVN